MAQEGDFYIKGEAGMGKMGGSEDKIWQEAQIALRSWLLTTSGSFARDWYAEQNSAELNGGRKPLL